MNNSQKIKEIIKAYNLHSQAAMAKQLGISPQLLAYWIKSDFMDVEKIKNSFPDINSDWLLTGNGEIIGGAINNGSGVVVNGQNTVGDIDNRHYTSDSPDVLRQDIARLETIIAEKEDRIKEKDAQIKEKDAQIKEKDAQINKLLDILKAK